MSRRKTVRMNNLVPDSKQLMKVKMFLNKNCLTKLQKNAYTFHSLYFQTDAGNQEFFVEGKWKAYLKGIVDIQVKTILLSAFNILPNYLNCFVFKPYNYH